MIIENLLNSCYEIIVEGSAGYVVSFGDALYRCMDAVTRHNSENEAKVPVRRNYVW